MKQNTKPRIVSRFTGYTLADCDCRLCLYWQGKRLGCLLTVCCCEEEKRQAAQREQTNIKEEN
jgi:hypothetical protein